MQIHDISVPITNDLPVWPGDPKASVEQVQSLAAGGPANVSHLSCSVHTGTHIDAPFHFVGDGATVDQISLEILVGPAFVCHLPAASAISAAMLEDSPIPLHTRRLLLRTKNSRLWAEGGGTFYEDYTALTEDAAQWVVARGIQLVGIDYLSIQLYSDFPATTTHTTLLEAGVIIIEGLDLGQVAEGSYDLFCLPLNLVGSDGAPARAILLDEGGLSTR